MEMVVWTLSLCAKRETCQKQKFLQVIVHDRQVNHHYFEIAVWADLVASHFSRQHMTLYYKEKAIMMKKGVGWQGLYWHTLEHVSDHHNKMNHASTMEEEVTFHFRKAAD